MNAMFNLSVFKRDLSGWDVSSCTNWGYLANNSYLSIEEIPLKFRANPNGPQGAYG